MPISQNGQTHSNNSSAILPTNCLSVFDHFLGLVLKGLNLLNIRSQIWQFLMKITKKCTTKFFVLLVYLHMLDKMRQHVFFWGFNNWGYGIFRQALNKVWTTCQMSWIKTLENLCCSVSIKSATAQVNKSTTLFALIWAKN